MRRCRHPCRESLAQSISEAFEAVRAFGVPIECKDAVKRAEALSRRCDALLHSLHAGFTPTPVLQG
jgi:hypothetical protein